MERLTRRLNNGKELCIDVCGEKCIEGRTWCPKCIPFTDVMKKLAEYEDAEEQGMLLRLPCKAKSIVYLIDHQLIRRKNQPFKCEVDEFVIERNGCYMLLNGCEPFYAMRRFKAINITNFGKTVFITKEEAEQALAKMKEGV